MFRLLTIQAFLHEIFLGNLKRKEEILLESGKSLEEILDGDCHIREFPFLFEFQVSKLSGFARIFFFSQTLISHMTKLTLKIFLSFFTQVGSASSYGPIDPSAHQARGWSGAQGKTLC